MAGAPYDSPISTQRSFEVAELVGLMQAGRVRVPKFQRAFKWELPEVLALLDSIHRGYPIGMLLLWQRPAAADRIVHGSLRVDAPAVTDALWVVDGQQRIVSLARALAGGEDEPFAACFDLRRGVFLRPSARGLQAHHLPLTALIDPEYLRKWTHERAISDEDRRTAIRLGDRMRQYAIPTSVITTNDEEAVREMFRRLNNTSRRMDEDEVFPALYSAGGAPASLAEVALSLRAVGFGLLDESTLREMLLAIGGPISVEDPAKAKPETEDLLRAARATLVFLRDDARIPHISLLPYRQPLFALARFFHRFPTPHPRSRELLARWLWRGAWMGAHGDSPSHEMLAVIDADEHASVQALLKMLPEAAVPEVELGACDFGRPRSKLDLLALLELGPVDVRSGAPVFKVMSEDDEPYRSTLRSLGSPGTIETLASLVFHPDVDDDLAQVLASCD